MDQTSIAKSKVRIMIRELKKRKADNFRVVGIGTWGNEGSRTPWFRSKRAKKQ